MVGKSELCCKLMLEYIVNLFPCYIPYIYKRNVSEEKSTIVIVLSRIIMIHLTLKP